MSKLDTILLRLAIGFWTVILFLSVAGTFAPHTTPMPSFGTPACTKASQSFAAWFVPVCRYN